MKPHKPGYCKKKAEVKGNKSHRQIHLPVQMQQSGQKGELLKQTEAEGEANEKRSHVPCTQLGNKNQNGKGQNWY